MTNMEINANASVLGEITAQFYDQTTLSDVDKKINLFLLSMREGSRNWEPKLRQLFSIAFVKLYRRGRLLEIKKRKNIICNTGFNALTRILTGDTTYTGKINKAILGTGEGQALASDTQLITESYRNDIMSGTADSNIAYLTAFFTELEVSGTFKEFGNCIDGAAGANTGKLWSHITGLNWVKDSTTVLVVSCKYTFQSN